MEPIVIAQSRLRWIVFLVVALSFVAAGALLLAIGESPLKAWGTIVFFGGCAVVFVWQIIDNRPRIVINNDGIVDRTLEVGVIEWSDIRAVWLYRKSGIPFVGLDLRDPAKYVARLSPLMQRMAVLNEKLEYPPLNLNLAGTMAVPEQVEALLQREIEQRSSEERT